MTHVIDTTDPTVAVHLRSCKQCADEVRTIESLVAALRSTSTRRASDTCLDPVDLAAAVDQMSSNGASQVHGHLATCERCAAEAGAMLRLFNSDAIQVEIAGLRTAESGRRGRWIAALGGVGLAAAAGIVLMVSGPRETSSDPTSVHRDPVIAREPQPSAVGPVGLIDLVTTFSWGPVQGANVYELVLYSADGTVIWESRAVENFVLLPDSVTITEGSPYFWMVRARVGFDRWVESNLVEFEIRKRGQN